MTKKMLDINVYDAAIFRLGWVFDTFPKVCLSFSGGKDSTVLFHLMASIAKEKKKKFSVLFIDWEAQYNMTIGHVRVMKELYAEFVEDFYWVALPLTTVNGVSQTQPEWISWAKGVQWVRNPPSEAIIDYDFFPFYRYAMTFEEFIPAFSEWLAGDSLLSSLIGIRADESLNRYCAVDSKKKIRFAHDKPWTTVSSGSGGKNVICYPLYDWKFSDIWTFNSRYKRQYNPLYNLMYQAGIPYKDMRICEPFGPEQRRGLWLYHVLEPETWDILCNRVAGAKCGEIYANETGGFFSLREKITKPNGITWQGYAEFLLDSMPTRTAEHYKNKIGVYLHWYQSHGWPENIPEEQDKDLGSKDIPSWRRVCKTLIKNDYWCRMLSFSPTKVQCYEQYFKRIKEQREKWNIKI